VKREYNIPLEDYTSLYVGGPASILIETEDSDSLQEVISKAQKPVTVLGYGTNVLVSDRGVSGSVIINKSGNIEVAGNGVIRADSGANWDELVQKAIANNLWGLEFSSGIPGGVGAAIAGNIAAYGHKVADTFVEATMLNTDDGSIFTWRKDDLGFDYRSSLLQKQENKHLVILKATFQLQPQPTGQLEYESALKTAAELSIEPDSLQNRRKIIIETRRKAGSLLSNTQTGPWTAGSFFKNPLVDETQVQAIIGHEESAISREQLLRQNVIHGGDKTRVSAAHVLLAAGFQRGQSWGSVRLHPNHILKIENTGGATAQQIYDVVQEIVQTVKQKLNINLVPEVQFIGEFS
jgi:UDP-N-acetylmuramate dehydrogenase